VEGLTEMSLPRAVLAKYLKRGLTFVETGARWGDSCIRALECGADAAWSCEIDPLFATLARMHIEDAIRGQSRFSVAECHSVYWLTNLRPLVRTVVLLDAHTERESPVIKEIEALGYWPTKPEVILIDDMRCMEGWGVRGEDIVTRLHSMGYAIAHEDGVAPHDILVGVL
jgi:hypothetical protein